MAKRFTITSLTCLLLAGVAFAGPHQLKRERFDARKGEKKIEGVTTFKSQKLKVGETSKNLNLPAKAPYHTDVIYDVTGDVKQYSKYSIGTEYSYLYGVYLYDGNYPAEIVWDGNTVYFKNPLTPYYSDSYIKGTLEDNTITVELPQTVEYYDEESFGLNLSMLKLDSYENDGEEIFTYRRDESITKITYTLSEDGSLTLNMPGIFDNENLPEYALGYVYTDIDPDYDGAWIGFSDFQQAYTPFDKTPATMPEGDDVETKTYSFIYGDYGFPVTIAFQNDKVFIQGLCQALPDAVIYGDIQTENPEIGPRPGDGVLIFIPQDQYLGIYMDQFFVYTKCVYPNPDIPDEDRDYYTNGYVLAPSEMGYYLLINPADNTMASVFNKMYLCFNVDSNRVNVIESYLDVKFIEQQEYSGTPANPVDLLFDDYYAENYGYYSFYFTLPCLSTEGRLLDTNNLYYRVYVDGEILEFIENSEGYGVNGQPLVFPMYDGITEPTDMLPIWFNNGWDIFKWTNTEIEVGIYIEGVTTLGVQSIYTYDNETTCSDIITIEAESGDLVASPAESKVDGLVNSNVISTQYYDLNGRRVMNPDKGIYIKKSILSDGNTVVKKVTRK